MSAAFSDSHPTLYVDSPWWNRLGSVLFGPQRTGLALPWTTYRDGWLSENAARLLSKKNVCLWSGPGFWMSFSTKNITKIISCLCTANVPPPLLLGISREGRGFDHGPQGGSSISRIFHRVLLQGVLLHRVLLHGVLLRRVVVKGSGKPACRPNDNEDH